MIRAIIENWDRAPMPSWPGAGERRRRRPTIMTREHVTIAPDAAELAALDALDLSDEGESAVPVAADTVALVIASAPRVALAAQARLGAGAVRHLITVNAMNRV